LVINSAFVLILHCPFSFVGTAAIHASVYVHRTHQLSCMISVWSCYCRRMWVYLAWRKQQAICYVKLWPEFVEE
jgi:hypothetical protein